jgi:hypothetical protein
VATHSSTQSTFQNTRPYFETMRQVLVKMALATGDAPVIGNVTGAIENVFDGYAAYYVLYEAIENLAKKEGSSYQAFLKESAKVLEQQEFEIPPSLFALAVQLEIPDVESDHSKLAVVKPSAWAEMKKAGKVTVPDKKLLQDLRDQRQRIWLSWNPEKSVK